MRNFHVRFRISRWRAVARNNRCSTYASAIVYEYYLPRIDIKVSRELNIKIVRVQGDITRAYRSASVTLRRKITKMDRARRKEIPGREIFFSRYS